MNNKLNNKSFGLPLTGVGLIGFAATSLGLLVVNKVMPMINGTFQAEFLPGVEGGLLNGMMAVFGVSFVVIALSYLLMILLGVNAFRFNKNPAAVKPRTGLAKFLIFTGVISFISGVVSITDVSTAADKFSLLFPAVAQIGFVIFYLMEVKSRKKETEALCA